MILKEQRGASKPPTGESKGCQRGDLPPSPAYICHLPRQVGSARAWSDRRGSQSLHSPVLGSFIASSSLSSFLCLAKVGRIKGRTQSFDGNHLHAQGLTGADEHYGVVILDWSCCPLDPLSVFPSAWPSCPAQLRSCSVIRLEGLAGIHERWRVYLTAFLKGFAHIRRC